MDRRELLRRYLETQGFKAGAGNVDIECGGYDGEVDIWYHNEHGKREVFTLPWDLNGFIDDLIKEMRNA